MKVSNNNNNKRSTDKNGRAVTKNGNYYSAARMGKDAKGNFWINGYFITSHGLTTFEGYQNAKSKIYVGNQNNQHHIMLHIEFFHVPTLGKYVEYVDICTSNGGTAVIKKLNRFINCAAKPHGSCTSIKTKMS